MYEWLEFFESEKSFGRDVVTERVRHVSSRFTAKIGVRPEISVYDGST